MCSPSSRGDGGGCLYSFQPAQSCPRMKTWRLCVGVIVALGFVQLMAQSPSPRRDINAVLAAHDRQLLELPDVVGVYVGVLADGKMPCLKVMLARPTPETERKLPREIEGYPVVAKISGEIRPLRPCNDQRRSKEF